MCSALQDARLDLIVKKLVMAWLDISTPTIFHVQIKFSWQNLDSEWCQVWANHLGTEKGKLQYEWSFQLQTISSTKYGYTFTNEFG